MSSMAPVVPSPAVSKQPPPLPSSSVRDSVRGTSIPPPVPVSAIPSAASASASIPPNRPAGFSALLSEIKASGGRVKGESNQTEDEKK